MTVSKCQKLAGYTIEDIDRSCPDDFIASWTAVWLMYQAVMVPLVSLFLHTALQRTTGARAADEHEVMAWRQQIQTAISWYGRKDVNISQKCKIMLQRLYDANCAVEQATGMPSTDMHNAVAPQWEPGLADRGAMFMPSVMEASDASPSGANLDQWLQTYEEPIHGSMTWNDMMWAYTGVNREEDVGGSFQDFQFAAF